MLTEWREAALRHTPAPADLVAAGQQALGPAAGAALVVFGVGLLVFGKKAAVPAAAFAMLAAVAVANYFRDVFPWWPHLQADPDRPLYPRFVAWHWLPALLVLAQLDGILAHGSSIPKWGGWRLKLGLGVLAALVLVPPGLYATWPLLYSGWPYPFRAQAWPILAFALFVGLGWAGSAAVARQTPGGVTGLGLSMAMFGASFVVVHAHTARFADALSIPAAALFVITIVAAFTKVEVTGAIPAVSLLLPAVMLVTAIETEGLHEIPWYAFLLPALPPLTVGLLAIPPLGKLTGVGRGILFWVLCLGPTVAAVILAARAETLPGAEW